MLEGTPIWTTGKMHLYLNNKPTKAYIPETNVQEAYELLTSRLSTEGRIPIGIDHLPDNIIKANPILAKLNLLDVGEITKIQYTDDAITIAEAELTNPQIRDLYEAGELDMVSIVADSTTSECPQGNDYTIVDHTDITRVDIVERGACPTCNIPKPTDSSETVVYARYNITEIEEEEEEDMSELTKEDIKAIFDESIDAKLAPLQEQIDTLKASEPTEPAAGDDDEKVKEMEARIAELQKETATAKVDSLIAAGKILPAQKESAVELCAKDAGQFEAMYKDAPVLIDLNTKKSLLAGQSDDDEELSDDEKLIAELNAKFSKGE